jgi:hypothetical protein
MALLTVVALQAPAVSTGLRYEPGPRGRALELPPIDLGVMPPLEFVSGDDRWPIWARWALMALITLITLAMLHGMRRLLQHLMRRAPATTVARTAAAAGAPVEANARILHSGLAAAIALLDSDRPPGNAVVQAWQSLEDAASAAGLSRRPAETSSEFTARILYRSHRSAAPIVVLLSLYQRVRFGEHEPTPADTAAARDALTLLVSLWQNDMPERRAPTVTV